VLVLAALVVLDVRPFGLDEAGSVLGSIGVAAAAVADRLERARRRFRDDRRGAVLSRRIQELIGGAPSRG
jgi:hypothetical protein